MNIKRVKELESLYLSKNEDELGILGEKLYSKNSTYEDEAKIAFKNVVRQKGIEIEDVLQLHKASVLKDENDIGTRNLEKNEKSDKRHRTLNRFFSYLGIPIAIFIGGQSLVQSYYEGVFTAVVLLCVAIYNLRE